MNAKPKKNFLMAISVFSTLGFSTMGILGNAKVVSADEELVPLVIFVSDAGKKAADDKGGTYELFNNDGQADREEKWLAFGRTKLNRYHVKGPGGAEIQYSEAASPSLTEDSSNDPKLINYWVKQSEVAASMKWLWKFPEVVKVTVDNITVLEQQGAADTDAFPCVIKLIVPNDASGLEAAKQISGIKGLGWNPENRALYYVYCETSDAYNELRETPMLDDFSFVSRSEFVRDGLMTKEFSRYFDASSTGAVRRLQHFTVGKKKSTSEILAKIPTDVPLIQLSQSKIVFLATDREFSQLSERLR